MVYLSPLGRVVIDGAGSTPLLSKPRWLFITLCTTLAVGILFCTTSEPIYHINAPPIMSLGICDL
ncbi:BCCT family transporter [Congregibacter sp.]|uniref:BCCT family transporter n=1 Tax=Congregibacter sp. TaxID=2744308 RepID=UPI0039E6FF80